MSFIASITAAELAADSSSPFFALVLKLAESPALQADPRYQPFWLAYIYDAEVNNGGHLQYFHNQGMDFLAETMDALRAIGAYRQADLLGECWAQVRDDPVTRVNSLEEYSALAHERSFDEEDRAYFRESSLLDLLESHYALLISESVAIVS